MKKSDCPAVVLILTEKMKFKANDIASILHRQKGEAFDLFIISCPKAQKIPESLKKMSETVFAADKDSIGASLNHILSITKNSVFAFLTDRVIPTHDHWLKRICDPVLNGNAEAVFGREIPTVDGNYFLIKDIEKAFPPEGNSVETKRFSINNCALKRPSQGDRRFPEKSVFDPAAYWAKMHSAKTVYQPEAIVTRRGDDTLPEIYSRYRQMGADNGACGEKGSLFKAAAAIAADTAADIKLSLSMKKPQHLWYPPLYRCAIHLGYYLGHWGIKKIDEKS